MRQRPLSTSAPLGRRARTTGATVAGLALALSALGGCGSESADPQAEAADVVEDAHAEAAHFDYDEESEHGPANWGSTPGWERCATGTRQSPIDVPIAQSGPLSEKVTIDYGVGTISALNNSHTVNIRPDGTNTVTYDNETYGLAQIHLHADSEHDLDGQSSPLEAHFVHGLLDEDGELAKTTDDDTDEEILAGYLVIGVMIDEGKENDSWGRVLTEDVLPPTPGDDYTLVDNAAFDPASLLPKDDTVHSYIGSLTTPTPTCVEGVNWFVHTTPVEVSAAQIETFTALYPNNSRPVQPRG